MKITNPATGEVFKEIADDTTASIQSKYQQLKEVQPVWAALPLDVRINFIRSFADVLEANAAHLATVLTSEVGKPLQQSKNELNGARARIKWLCDNASKFLSDEVMVRDPKMEERISYEPLGVIGNISAWNYPYLVGVNVFVPALLAGNAVLYKPSEFASLTGLEIAKALYEAGVPENVFQVALGGKEAGEALLDLPLNGYFFTGSYKTGKYIYERVAPKMVPCQCELGGKDPLYVADDIGDVRSVAAGTADGAFYNNGQSCCAVERIYAHEKIYDRYVDEFVKEVKTYKLGAPEEPGVYVGPLTRPSQLELLAAQVKEAVDKGASLLTGGKKVDRKGFYFEPTVLTNVTHDMSIMREESFGPVIGIMKVKDDEEAIRMMSDTEYGLTAAVYSSDKSRAEKILGKVDAGTGYWNCCDRVSAAVPWSGRKHSGFGATLSHVGLRAFTKPKSYQLRG
jgi:acyl-CoA reductase-like NAD-dependent aldehyde dehydrogenase